MKMSVEHRLIKDFENMTPEETVYQLSYRTGSLKENLEVVSRIRKYNLSNGVMNVLIHITFIICDARLSLGFMEKIAEDWLRKRIRTVKEAYEISKTQHMKYKEWAVNAVRL